MNQVLDGDKIAIHIFKSNSADSLSILIDHVRGDQLLGTITKK